MLPRTSSFFPLLSLTTVFPAASPVNDSFATRTNLTGAAFPVAGTTVEATAEPGEPGPAAGSSATRSIWWTWTASATGWYDVRTTGSPVDTQLSIFRGNSLTALTRLAGNDDDPLSSTPTTSSRVRLEAAAGTPYQISVNGFEGAGGPCFLIVEPATQPANRVNTPEFRSGQPLQRLTRSGLGTLPAVTLGYPGGVPVLTLGYLRRRAVSQPGLAYQPQFGPDPLQLATALSPIETTTPLSATWEWVEIQDPAPGSNRRFTRLRLEKP